MGWMDDGQARGGGRVAKWVGEVGEQKWVAGVIG